jgi:hypothetical protein
MDGADGLSRMIFGNCMHISGSVSVYFYALFCGDKLGDGELSISSYVSEDTIRRW